MPISITVTEFHPHSDILRVGAIPFPSQGFVGLAQQIRNSFNRNCEILVSIVFEDLSCDSKIAQSLLIVFSLLVVLNFGQIALQAARSEIGVFLPVTGVIVFA